MIKDKKQDPTVLKIDEFYNECKEFSYKYKGKRWVTFYDVETAFKCMLSDDLSDFTIEILIRLKQAIESYEKKCMSKVTPMKALKIIFDTARKSIVI